jgi:hypothetical protein
VCGNTQNLGHLGHDATEKVAEFDQHSLAGRLLCQPIQGFVNGHNFERVARVFRGEVIRFRPPVDHAAAMFATQFAARIVDEDAAYGFGGDGR